MTVQKAIDFATEAHKGQVRKYTGEPYINHPTAVAVLVNVPWSTTEMFQAAYLHDTIEDCDVTRGDILREFGETVYTYVNFLTDISVPEDGNREMRKRIDRLHLRDCPFAKEIHTIKLADLIDNSRSIIEFDPGFAKTYLKEKRSILFDMAMVGQADKGLLKAAIVYTEI